VGLFKKISQVVRAPVSALMAGHQFTAGLVKAAPKALGLKSTGSAAIVKATQGAMLAGGATALGIGGLTSATTRPAVPSGTLPIDEELSGVLVRLVGAAHTHQRR
jgi:hypothetical protein